MAETFSITRRSLIAGLGATALAGSVVATEALPEIAVMKDPTCGCCEKWITHLREEGFTVAVTDGPVTPLKVRLGVPRELSSCHTAQVGGYVVEGHVPAGAIRRLLAEKPQGIGLAVPGMPTGSPGMEAEGTEPATYDVVLFGSGEPSTFARYRGGQAI